MAVSAAHRRCTYVCKSIAHWQSGAGHYHFAPLLGKARQQAAKQALPSDSAGALLISSLPPQVLFEMQYCGTDADVWSCGVALYVLLTGVFPFARPDDEDGNNAKQMRHMFRRIIEGDYYPIPDVRLCTLNVSLMLAAVQTNDLQSRVDGLLSACLDVASPLYLPCAMAQASAAKHLDPFTSLNVRWACCLVVVLTYFVLAVQLSPECQHLIHHMFRPNPEERCTIEDIMRHPWFIKDLPPQLVHINSYLLHAKVRSASLMLQHLSARYAEVFRPPMCLVAAVFRHHNPHASTAPAFSPSQAAEY